MTRKELNDTIRHYRAGVDDGFHTGLMRDEGDAIRDDIDTLHSAQRTALATTTAANCTAK